MDIRSDALQIWRYDAGRDGAGGRYVLETEQPLVSMADADTLAAFIRWGVEHYPAKKYGLVLWGHGGGSAMGVLIDELFDGSYMTLDVLGQALHDSGTHFEAVLFDACMMASIETACAIEKDAEWMIASEEMVAGHGTAMGDWLQQLYCVPDADGRLLSRWICDTAMIKYGNMDDRRNQELITWSVIDLNRIGELQDCLDSFLKSVSELYQQHPDILFEYAEAVNDCATFGTEYERMYDLGDVIAHLSLRTLADNSMQLRMQETLADAINYCVHGAGRPASRGLSFCYPTTFASDRIEVYAKNCPSPYYLALLDAIGPWTAPPRVYEKAARLPEMMENGGIKVKVRKSVWTNGSPAFSVLEGDQYISTVTYNLYKEDEESGQTIKLGKVPVYYDSDAGLYRVYDLVRWPSIDGNLCQIVLQNLVTVGNYNMLYNIPIMVDAEIMNMRCVYWFNKAAYEVLGLWEGYDNDSSTFNRNVTSLSMVAGREYRMLYEVVDGEHSEKTYHYTEPMTMYRSLTLDEITLPSGTYSIQFSVMDSFMRPMPMEMVEFTWDGTDIRILNSDWEGTAELDVSLYYEQTENSLSPEE